MDTWLIYVYNKCIQHRKHHKVDFLLLGLYKKHFRFFLSVVNTRVETGGGRGLQNVWVSKICKNRKIRIKTTNLCEIARNVPWNKKLFHMHYMSVLSFLLFNIVAHPTYIPLSSGTFYDIVHRLVRNFWRVISFLVVIYTVRVVFRIFCKNFIAYHYGEWM